MGYFLSVFTKPILSVCFFFFLVSSDHRSQSHFWSSSRVWQLNMLEFVFGWARRIFLETLPNNMWWCRCCLTFFFFFFKVFYPETIFCSSPAVVLGEFLATQTLSHHALGRYRHTSSSRQFRNILCWLEILNYCPDGGNGEFSLLFS